MLIDWFTVFAQIVNFLILVALLRRFLYRPIVQAMQTREATIAARVAEAEDKKREAEAMAEGYRLKNAELQEAREQLLQQAKEEAEARRQELIKTAHDEVGEMRARWQGSIQQEKEAFVHELRRRVGHQALTVAHRALADLADSDLEAQVVKVFIERLKGLDGEARTTIAGQSAGLGIVVRSAFGIQPDTQDAIREAVRNHLAPDSDVRFEASSDLIGGVELRAGGYKIAWNLADYVETLDETLAGALGERGIEA